MVEALDIWVRGIVQGVGFRPFVYRMARKYLINGWVLNATDGVHVHAEGESKLLDEFVLELSENAPAAAQVSEIEMREVPLEDFDSFEIRFSDAADASETTLVSPDLATCDECLAEMFNPNDRRFRYPFINCTNCGPRFTIIEELPYDRAATSMRDFEMCPRCAAEYADPADRRYHAQPNACFECGPVLTWKVAQGTDAPVISGVTRAESDAILSEAVRLLLEGKILAVKGLGGYHLACDANNAAAVAELRARKHREGKAFAVMMASAADAARICEVSAEEKAVLESPQRPIVLLKKRAGADELIAPGVADRLFELGVMLPATPVQHLLMHDFAQAFTATQTPPMLVMTSGNIHDEPIVTNDEQAYDRLAGVADAFLGNNRAILTRFDDSVLRVILAGTETAVQFVRRARGFAPSPIEVDLGDAPAGASSGCLFATGPEQKSTLALMRAKKDGKAEVFVSQHIGDMENAETYDAWLEAKRRFEQLFRLSPAKVACDMHPEYLSSKWAHDQALPVREVQHHHAHIVSVMAENGLSEAVLGFAFDGTGYGVDGCIWGGEVLLANRCDFERFANFAYVPMPGGPAAVKNPLRMAYGVLWDFDLLDHPAASPALAKLGEAAQVCDAMIERGLNTPLTSSVGRLFDAASALLGLCVSPTYESEAATVLGSALYREQEPAIDDARERYAVAITKNTATETSTAQDTSVLLLDAAPTFRALLDDLRDGVPVCVIARRFHDAFVDVVVSVAELARALYGISTVALSGGVFMNRYLIERSLDRLQAAGFTVAVNRDLPPNDGSISLGQAVVAWSAERAE